MDTFNKFMVGVQGENLIILNLGPIPHRLTKSEALNLAAYLVTMTFADEKEFAAWLAAVQGA